MAQNTQFDARQFEDLDLPYNRVLHPLSQVPRLVGGYDNYVTFGGSSCKRPGTLTISPRSDETICYRLWVYRTMESATQTYLIGSFLDTGTGLYYLEYCNLTSAPTTWTSLGSYRSIDVSALPHEGVQARGKFYIKAFPGASTGEKLGTVIFDGTGGTVTVRPWGALGPTTAARIVGVVGKLTAAMTDTQTTLSWSVTVGAFPVGFPFTLQVEYERVSVTSLAAPGVYNVTRGVEGTTASAHDLGILLLYRDGWTASSHEVNVAQGWFYTYTLKSLTDNVTNRAILEENPDYPPSNTGPFVNLCPRITLPLVGSDTTNFPTVCIYRTTDGGGTFYKLDEVTNTGTNLVYEDNTLGSGAAGTTESDPVPDAFLDTSQIAPSLTSNSPPPSCVAPLIVGVDAIQPSSPLAYFQGRIWYWIDNILLYSAQEELTEGIPEECFPSGLNGNFFRLQDEGQNLIATNSALYSWSESQTYILTGSTKETFNIAPLYDNYGAARNQHRAVTRYGSNVVFLTQDFRLAVIRDPSSKQPDVISDPLYTDFRDILQSNDNVFFDIEYWADLEKEWLVIGVCVPETPSNSKVYVYDIKKSTIRQMDFWNTPWSIPLTALASGIVPSPPSEQQRLLFYIAKDGEDSCVNYIDPTVEVGSDSFNGDNVNFGWQIQTSLLTLPAGNHVNALREPTLDPDFYGVLYDRILYPGDIDPSVWVYNDDMWTTPLPLNFVNNPSRRGTSKGYASRLLTSPEGVGHRVAIQMQREATSDLVQVLNLTLAWLPDAGSGP
jgi:hypothetical protein